MKKLLALILAAFMMIAMFAACGEEVKEETKKEKRIEIKEETDEVKLRVAIEKAFKDSQERMLKQVTEQFEGDEKKEIEKLAEEYIDVIIKRPDIRISDIKIDGNKAVATAVGQMPDLTTMEKMLEEEMAKYDEPETDFEFYKLFIKAKTKVMGEIELSEEMETIAEFEKNGDEWVLTNSEDFLE